MEIVGNESELEECILKMFEIGVVKFGDFILKSGIHSPIYFDLRIIISYPKLLETVANLLWKLISEKNCDQLCGVPYTALPIATVLSIKHDIPMLIRRKEAKSYGTKKLIEGEYKEGESCLIIEDVIVSGSSVVETVEILRKEKLIVKDVVVFLDREQGGKNNLLSRDISVSSIVGVTQLLEILLRNAKIDEEIFDKCRKFFQAHHSVSIPSTSLSTICDNNSYMKSDVRDISILRRIELATHPLVKKIWQLILRKKSNLCLAADVPSSKELLEIAERVGRHICILKTHVDILNDFTPETILRLREAAAKHDFLLFEDRKFGDIGNTVQMQFEGGLYKISEWADIVTIHGIPGPGVVKGLISGEEPNSSKGFLIVAEMSSEGNLANFDYAKGCVKIAEDHPESIIGFVAQRRLTNSSNYLLFTPGVNLESSKDHLGQKYVSVKEAVIEKGTDVVIVGRGIIKAPDPQITAQLYQTEAYDALF